MFIDSFNDQSILTWKALDYLYLQRLERLPLAEKKIAWQAPGCEDLYEQTCPFESSALTHMVQSERSEASIPAPSFILACS